MHNVCECDALLTDHPVIRCCDPTATHPSYISALSRVEPELCGVEVYVCVTAISCVKGLPCSNSTNFCDDIEHVGKFCIHLDFYFVKHFD